VNVGAAVRPSLPGSDPHGAGRLRCACGCLRFELTEREAAVLGFLAEGMSTEDAANALYVSHQAVTYHVGNLLGKFQCSNRTGMVAKAFVLGVLPCSWPPRVQRGLLSVTHVSRMCGIS
jgi:DNA-binding NarL/FixJ family response regulator